MRIDKADKDAIVAHKDVTFDSVLSELMAKYDELIFEIVCLGIHNKKGDMARLVPGGTERQLYMGRPVYPFERYPLSSGL